MFCEKKLSVIRRKNPGGVYEAFWCLGVLLVLLVVLQSCNTTDGTKSPLEVQYALETFNGEPVTIDKEFGLVGGRITLGSDGNIIQKKDYRMQDGSDQQNVYIGTYEIEGPELKITFSESSGYQWTPPNASLEGDTLTFYNPCVNCAGFDFYHEEVYVRR